MFTRLLLMLSLMIMATQSFALEGFVKEGGGYGVKPIREIIKESEEGLHGETDLHSWMDQREQTLEFHELITLYRHALNIRREVMSLYNGLNDEDFSKRRREILFIQGLLIVDINQVDSMMLNNGVRLPQHKIFEMSEESQAILNIQIEDGYLIIDLLKKHNIHEIRTKIENSVFYL